MTGRRRAGNICRHYPGRLLQSIVVLLFVTNAINIGANLGAMEDATRLLIGVPVRISEKAMAGSSSTRWFPEGAQRRLRISDKYKRVDPRVASYALRGDGLIFTTFDGGLGLSRRNALATLSASCAKRYGFRRTRSPSAGENAAMSA